MARKNNTVANEAKLRLYFEEAKQKGEEINVTNAAAIGVSARTLYNKGHAAIIHKAVQIQQETANRQPTYRERNTALVAANMNEVAVHGFS